MSKYIDDIIEDLRANPLKWSNDKGDGVTKGNISVKGVGGMLWLPLIGVWVDGSEVPSTWSDRRKLEKAVRAWYRSVPLQHLTV